MRRALLAAAALLGGLALAAPAGAAGVGGVEVTPPSGSSFTVRVPADASVTQAFTLRNVGTAPASVRLYAAEAQQVDGAWSVGRAGSAPWLHLADQTVTLQPGQVSPLRFQVDGGGARTGAVVVEQSRGTVVQRAATLVHATPAPRVPVPLLLAAAAVVLVLAAGAGVGAAARRRVARVAA